jgi:hypothetical protein
MAEFSIADHGVTKRQKIKFIDGSWSQEAQDPQRKWQFALPRIEGPQKILTLIRNSKV